MLRYPFGPFRRDGHSPFFCVLATAAMFSLTACNAYQYKRFEAPDAALVRLINASNTEVYVRESHRGDCSDGWPFNDDGSGILPGASRSTPVLPGTFFVIVPNGNLSFHSSRASSCIVSVGFKVEPKGTYELSYHVKDESCFLTARWKNSGDWQPLHLTKMKPKNLFSNPVTCEKAEESTR